MDEPVHEIIVVPWDPPAYADPFIALRCDCGWIHTFAFGPVPLSDILPIATEHLRDVTPPAPRCTR